MAIETHPDVAEPAGSGPAVGDDRPAVHRRGHGLHRLGTPPGHHDLSALGVQGQGDGPAQATVAAGHEGVRPTQLSHGS